MASFIITYRKPGEKVDKTVTVSGLRNAEVHLRFAKAHPTWHVKSVRHKK